LNRAGRKRGEAFYSSGTADKGSWGEVFDGTEKCACGGGKSASTPLREKQKQHRRITKTRKRVHVSGRLLLKKKRPHPGGKGIIAGPWPKSKRSQIKEGVRGPGKL